MNNNEATKISLIVPALGRIYAALDPYKYTILRVMMGLFYVPHGAQKLFGWFGGARWTRMSRAFPVWASSGANLAGFITSDAWSSSADC